MYKSRQICHLLSSSETKVKRHLSESSDNILTSTFRKSFFDTQVFWSIIDNQIALSSFHLDLERNRIQRILL